MRNINEGRKKRTRKRETKKEKLKMEEAPKNFKKAKGNTEKYTKNALFWGETGFF